MKQPWCETYLVGIFQIRPNYFSHSDIYISISRNFIVRWIYSVTNNGKNFLKLLGYCVFLSFLFLPLIHIFLGKGSSAVCVKFWNISIFDHRTVYGKLLWKCLERDTWIVRLTSKASLFSKKKYSPVFSGLPHSRFSFADEHNMKNMGPIIVRLKLV